MNLKGLIGAQIGVILVVLLLNGALLAGAIWLVVVVLRALGVLPS